MVTRFPKPFWSVRIFRIPEFPINPTKIQSRRASMPSPKPPTHAKVRDALAKLQGVNPR
jgi:hypothetical protein